jgi:CBS domain containing-hemolysin-like protein
MAYRLIILVVIVLLNGFFAASEVALVSVRRSRLRALADRGWSSAQSALDLLEHPERLLSVTQFGVTLASLGLGWAGEDTIFELILGGLHPVITPASEALFRGIAFGAAFLLISYAHVIIGEVVPKNLALEKADRLALLVAPVLLIFYRISGPFVYTIEKSSSMISKALGLRGDHTGGGHSAEELKFIVRSSLKEGHLESFEEGAIQKLLELQDYSAREIMVPRNDIVSVAYSSNLDEVLRTFEETKFSRLPVHRGSREKIIGILHYKDLVRLWLERKWAWERRRPERPFRLERYLRKPLVVPETKPLPQLLGEFREAHTHLALVVDEFGTISGLVTLEDVLEQVFGEIGDEHDSTRPALPAESNVLEVEGTIPIRDLETLYGIELPQEAGFETLAGFILFQLGYIPKDGDEIVHEGRRFVIDSMERNRIARVRIEKIAVPAEETAEGGLS